MPTIRTDAIEAEIDEKTLTVRARDLRTGFVWQMQAEGPGDIGMKGCSGPWCGLAFRSAGTVTWTGNGVEQRARLSHWPYRSNVWSPSDYAVEVTFRAAADELQIEVATINGRGEVSWIDGYYPRGFLFPKKTGGDLVLPIGQGCLLKKDFPCELDHTLPAYVARGFVMPWWGQLADSGEGLLAVTDTPDDIAFRVVTEAHGGGHTCHPYWQASLGNFRYPRRMKYRFFDKADVVTLAKGYRRHAASRGQAVTLKEKVQDRPAVDKLRGSMIFCIWLMSDFSMYPEWNVKPTQRYMTADEGLKRYQRLIRDAGIGKAFVHVDGWCKRGYDFSHPDCLPPDEKIGGWNGLRRMADSIQAMGHGFMLHDQYADIFAHTEAFKPENTTLDLSGVRAENREWLGGRQQWLCPLRTMQFFQRNLTEVRDQLKPSGSFLDCFSAGPLRECYDQTHLCSRGDAREAWSAMFAMGRSFGWVTASEGGADWSIPVLDYVERVSAGLCPFDLNESLKRPLGDPIPLYNLVWHDCVVNPNIIMDATGSDPDEPLWAMLWAGIPQVRPRGFDCDQHSPGEKETAFVRSLKPIMELSEQVGFEEMVNLEFLDADRHVQRTTFSNGTQVTVNFCSKTYQLKYTGQQATKPAAFMRPE